MRRYGTTAVPLTFKVAEDAAPTKVASKEDASPTIDSNIEIEYQK